ESPDAVNGIHPTRYRSGDYYAGILRSFPDYVVRVGGTLNTYSYSNVLSTSGIIDNGGRDRREYELGARVSYRLTQSLLPFVQMYWVDRSYDRALDTYGYRRSSTGYRTAVGISGDLLPQLQGEAYAGVLIQNYEDARFHGVSDPDFGVRLNWKPVSGTSVRGFIDRSVEETTLLGSSGYLRTAVGGSFEQVVRPDLTMTGHFYYSENAYADVNRIDHVSDAGLGFKYFFIPNIYFATDYAFIHRTSSTATDDFYENRIWFRIGAQLTPAYTADPDTFLPVVDTTRPGGFYVAALAGNGTLTSAVDGPRGGEGGGAGTGGELTADFGSNGWQGDIAAGYGALVGRIYLGGEVDAALGSQHWLHGGGGGTRIFGVSQRDSYEIAARLGYVLENHALLYGRFGAVMTQFATFYHQGSHIVRPEGYQRGLRFGGGVEVPLGGALSGRIEYTQTSYADYNVKAGGPAGSGPDNFANEENLLRFGVVYHIDSEAPGKPAPAFNFGGAYAGVQAGFGGLISQNAGPRKSGQTLNAQRAGYGATGGAFAGYGIALGNQYYLGGELDAEGSNTDWNIERDPTGRIYSVSKIYSLGASMLAGYIFKENTLVYGRIGVVHTRFANKYHDEGGANYVTPDISKNGFRLGGGVAVPLSRHTFLRLDYTWTRYGSYKVNYVTGTDSFRNSENLFRVGIAWKF
ncbi:MAG: outer membrane beta-barrel protein, partial [Alphaproteobacteria bacterium]|nr:outer membrane beta-barrel protein [Alphaproteobacteria bacterium]